MASNKTVKTSDEILCEGELEKRSDSLFQVWKKKRCVLTADRLRLFSGNSGRVKELCFNSILKVDCVEHTSKYVYFTIVTNFYKEIDFRCTARSCWNAAITMALIDFQNRRALEDFRRYRYQRSASETQSETESGELWVRGEYRPRSRHRSTGHGASGWVMPPSRENFDFKSHGVGGGCGGILRL